MVPAARLLLPWNCGAKDKIINKLPLIMNNKLKNQEGFIALIALLIVVAAGLTIGIAVSLGGIEEIQTSFGIGQAGKAKNLANSCIEEGLGRLRENWANYSGSLSIGGNSCIINTVINGSLANVTAIGTVDVHTQKIQIQVDNNLNVIAWQEE